MKPRKQAPKVASKGLAGSSGNQDPRLVGPSVEEIRLRAYEIYLSRGRSDGDHLVDWFQAEKELTEIIRKRQST